MKKVIGGVLLAPFMVMGAATLIGSFLQHPFIFIACLAAVVGGILLMADQ